jgi:type III secretory pathway component EscS
MLNSWIVAIIFIIVFVYAILKEREELGCYRLSIGRQCIDENSVYLKNTKAEPTDNCKDLHQRMESILSYQEKAAIWRRCIIIASIIGYLIYCVYSINSSLNSTTHYAILVLVIFALLYFYHNYINYHHFRKLKQNGIEILQMIKQKCIG